MKHGRREIRINRTPLIAGLTLFAILLAGTLPAEPVSSTGDAPRLIVLVVVDQMRYDYLPRFAAGFSGGFQRLMTEGAVFTNAHLDHYPSVTAVGHAAMLTGAPPSVSGIIGNDWYDRAEKRNVTSVEDTGTARVGAEEATGSSPHRLKVTQGAVDQRSTGMLVVKGEAHAL